MSPNDETAHDAPDEEAESLDPRELSEAAARKIAQQRDEARKVRPAHLTREQLAQQYERLGASGVEAAAYRARAYRERTKKRP